MSDMIRMNLEISPELFETLETLADRSGTTLSVVFRKAIELIRIAADAKRHGQAVGVVDRKSKRLVREIVGV